MLVGAFRSRLKRTSRLLRPSPLCGKLKKRGRVGEEEEGVEEGNGRRCTYIIMLEWIYCNQFGLYPMRLVRKKDSRETISPNVRADMSHSYMQCSHTQ